MTSPYAPPRPNDENTKRAVLLRARELAPGAVRACVVTDASELNAQAIAAFIRNVVQTIDADLYFSAAASALNGRTEIVVEESAWTVSLNAARAALAREWQQEESRA